MATQTDTHTVTKNACKLCTPLGAAIAYKGIRGAIPLLHGSQGCATYIRRYLISHFREPIDIASSNFSEETAVFGGGANMKLAVENVTSQYEPEVVGIATTCLSETIGDDVPMFLKEIEKTRNGGPVLIHAATPSYSGTHADGFREAVLQTVKTLAEKDSGAQRHINLFPGMVSPEDLRHLKEILNDFHTPFVMLPDYSETMDGASWSEYQKIPQGGTGVDEIRASADALASIEFGRVTEREESAGGFLQAAFDVRNHSLGLPVGVRETDRFFQRLEQITGLKTPEMYVKERGRLIDAYVDGHKYISGKKAAVYGEEDFVAAMASFLDEIGIVPVICASGGRSGHFEKAVGSAIPDYREKGIDVIEGADFVEIEEMIKELTPDIIVGGSKGYRIARDSGIPLVRVGFPIHDRIGASRVLHLGYRGAQGLFDRIVNAVLEKKQTDSDVGYSYL